MSIVNAYGGTSPTGPLAEMTISRREVGPHDVLIDIKYCGICHSDIHYVRGHWGLVSYPVVPGHEIAGVVAAVGSSVTKHAVGDRVGVGCMVNSCGECSSCAKGEEQYCLKGSTQTYGGSDRDGTTTQGGYSTRVVVNDAFVIKVPDEVSLESAAPLLCAGITTYSPLRRWGVGPGQKVAVVGLGGLGHMAVKFAHVMSADVTVLSQSLRKQQDGKRFGADHYYATNDPTTFSVLADRFDLIINTVGTTQDLDALLGLLAVDGTLVNVGAPGDALTFSVFSLLTRRRSFSGSAIGGIAETEEMLNFCAEHGVAPEIEVISADQINDAWDRVLASDVRYRFVIDTTTLD
jgi:uncharacterized zinc-type alcohol dehydrogenase-like protein